MGAFDRNGMGLRTRVIHAATGGIVVGCVVACGSSSTYLNRLAVQHSIAQSLLAQRQVHTAVVCPSQIPQHKGRSFQCAARFDVGSYVVAVTETDGKGHLHWNAQAPLALLDVKHVTAAIQRSVLRQRGVRATVACPRSVLQRAGLTFTCAATVRAGTSDVKPGTYPFRVTEDNAAGHVVYVGG